MKLNHLGKKVRKLISLSLAFLLIISFFELELKAQPEAASSWTTVNPGFGSTSYANTIAYGDGNWLLFAQGEGFGKSADGTAFVQHASKENFPCLVNDAMHIGTQWIAACHNGNIYTLEDGLDLLDAEQWIKRNTGRSNRLVSIATDGTTIVVVGSSGGTILTSTNGHTWDDHSLNNVIGFNAVTYGQGKFVAVGKATDNSDVIYASLDGITWGRITSATPSRLLYGINYGGGKFVAVGSSGYIYVSDNGVTWNQKTAPAGAETLNFNKVSYAANQFFIGGTNQSILTSQDGSAFTIENIGSSGSSIYSIMAANGRAIAAGSSGLLLTRDLTPPLSSEASLDSLLMSPTVDVTRDPVTNSFTVKVPYGTTSVTVTPTLKDKKATMTVNGTQKNSGQSTTVTLDADGSTEIIVVVTAEDGVTTKTYSVKVIASNNGNLSSLIINGTPVSGFQKTKYDYNVEVPYGTNNIDVSWSLDEPSTQILAAVKIDDVSQTLSPISGLSLTPGVARKIEIHVKAQSGQITTYVLTVTQAMPLVNKANLQAKVTEINNENLVEEDYTQVSWDTLKNALTAAQTILDNLNTTQAEVDDALATLQNARQDLEPQDITPPDWSTGSELSITDITQTSVKLVWPAADDNVAVIGYRLYVDGDEKVNEISSEYEYSATEDVYAYTITGLDADTSYHFTVKAYDDAGNVSEPGLSQTAATLKRPSTGGGWYLSNNANLKMLEVWTEDERISLTPSFQADILSYTVKTEAKQLKVKAPAEHPAAKVYWQGESLGDGLQIELQEGENIIPFVVQAENGSRTTYTLVVERIKSDEEETEGLIVSFADIAGHWAANYIELAATKGIVNGYPDGMFKPNNSITRAEFTIMLIGALKPDITGEALVFNDAEHIGEWAKQSVGQAVGLGIITGYADGNFRPGAQISRAEMAVMIARALQLPTASSTSTDFADDEDIPNWAKGRVEALRERGIITGRNGNRFAANETATRAEAAVMLLRMLESD